MRWGNSPAHDAPAVPFHCCITGICRCKQVTELHETVDVVLSSVAGTFDTLKGRGMPRAISHLPERPCT